ncbi:unnamed protein product [Dibothriocephalus latus]|uniref:Uncharacterized protein n=1 Tax=Dibothriocephalus latus TaxID=60516 RepID=A0A3P7P730_DIBLA|nr:unnamed protein product [Dibothriocephalus latus]
MKMVKNLGHLPFEDRLTELDLLSLKYKQLCGDLIKIYRIVRGRECVLEFEEFFELARIYHLWGHPFHLQMKPVPMVFQRNAFPQRVIRTWNGLPDEGVLSDTVETFKRKLDSHQLRNCDT